MKSSIFSCCPPCTIFNPSVRGGQQLAADRMEQNMFKSWKNTDYLAAAITYGMFFALIAGYMVFGIEETRQLLIG